MSDSKYFSPSSYSDDDDDDSAIPYDMPLNDASLSYAQLLTPKSILVVSVALILIGLGLASLPHLIPPAGFSSTSHFFQDGLLHQDRRLERASAIQFSARTANANQVGKSDADQHADTETHTANVAIHSFTSAPSTFRFDDPLYKMATTNLPASFCLTLTDYLNGDIKIKPGTKRADIGYLPSQPDSILLLEYLAIKDLGVGVGDTRLYRTLIRAMCGYRMHVSNVGGSISSPILNAHDVKGRTMHYYVAEWFDQTFPATLQHGHHKYHANRAVRATSSQTGAFCYQSQFDPIAKELGREEKAKDDEAGYKRTPPHPLVKKMFPEWEKQLEEHWPDLMIMEYAVNDNMVPDPEMPMPVSSSYERLRHAASQNKPSDPCYHPNQQTEDFAEALDGEASQEPNAHNYYDKFLRDEDYLDLPIWVEGLTRIAFKASNTAVFAVWIGADIQRSTYRNLCNNDRCWFTGEANWYDAANYYHLPHTSVTDHLHSWEKTDTRWQKWTTDWTLRENILQYIWNGGLLTDGVHCSHVGHQFYAYHMREELEKYVRELQLFIESVTRPSYHLFTPAEFVDGLLASNNFVEARPLEFVPKDVSFPKSVQTETNKELPTERQITVLARQCPVDSMSNKLPPPIFPLNYQPDYICATCWNGQYVSPTENQCSRYKDIGLYLEKDPDWNFGDTDPNSGHDRWCWMSEQRGARISFAVPLPPLLPNGITRLGFQYRRDFFTAAESSVTGEINFRLMKGLSLTPCEDAHERSKVEKELSRSSLRWFLRKVPISSMTMKYLESLITEFSAKRSHHSAMLDIMFSAKHATLVPLQYKANKWDVPMAKINFYPVMLPNTTTLAADFMQELPLFEQKSAADTSAKPVTPSTDSTTSNSTELSEASVETILAPHRVNPWNVPAVDLRYPMSDKLDLHAFQTEPNAHWKQREKVSTYTDHVCVAYSLGTQQVNIRTADPTPSAGKIIMVGLAYNVAKN